VLVPQPTRAVGSVRPSVLVPQPQPTRAVGSVRPCWCLSQRER
jgi:hypothetical protein